MVGPGQGVLWNNGHQLSLDLIGRLAIGQLEPVGDPVDVGVDGDGRFDIELVQHHAGSLSAHSRKGFKRGPVGRHLSAMLVDQDLRQGDDILGLVAVEPDGLDVLRDPLQTQGQHVSWIVGLFEQRLDGLVDALVRGLSRQDHRDQKRIGVGKMKFGARVGIGRFKARKQDLDPFTLLRRQAFSARLGFGFSRSFSERFGLTDHA